MIQGRLIISLDFELFWGMSDLMDLESLETLNYFRQTRTILEDYIKIFQEYDVKVTWATVGILFANDYQELQKFLPTSKPSYKKKKLDNLSKIETVANHPDIAFAKKSILRINKFENFEIGSHTFSHYYVQEDKQNLEAFKADCDSFNKIYENTFERKVQSLVLPRNQLTKKTVSTVKSTGIKVIRIKPKQWFWKKNSILYRIFRFIEVINPMINVDNFKTEIKDDMCFTVGTRFLRPLTKNNRLFCLVQKNKILREMKIAATENKDYHLWWHPHNFAINTEENFKILKEILEYYKSLNESYNFSSVRMEDLTKDLK